MNQTIRFELTAVFATAALLILCSMAYAQNWYFLNRHPAPYGVAHRMATKARPTATIGCVPTGTGGRKAIRPSSGISVTPSLCSSKRSVGRFATSSAQ